MQVVAFRLSQPPLPEVCLGPQQGAAASGAAAGFSFGLPAAGDVALEFRHAYWTDCMLTNYKLHALRMGDFVARYCMKAYRQVLQRNGIQGEV